VLLDDDVVRIIVETAQGIEERYDIEFERIGCDGDHTHILWRDSLYGLLKTISTITFQQVTPPSSTTRPRLSARLLK